LEEHSAKPPVDQTSAEMPRLPTRKAFIVHGHDEGAREAVARFLVQIGFTPIILHEQPSQSGTVIEKIEAHGDVGFAVGFSDIDRQFDDRR
jgi:predicted nucleotide-binding protein